MPWSRLWLQIDANRICLPATLGLGRTRLSGGEGCEGKPGLRWRAGAGKLAGCSDGDGSNSRLIDMYKDKGCKMDQVLA